MRQFIKAQAVWVEGTHLRHNAVVCVENGKVTDVLSEHQVTLDPASVPIIEEQLLLPGFINSHAHLEYSFCRGRLPRGEVSFTDWIDAIGVLKRTVTPEEIVKSAKAAMNELLAGGTTSVIDCAHRPEMRSIWAESPLRHMILWELIALDDDQAEKVWGDALQLLQMPRPSHCLATGLNPHAPYSVGPRLRTRLRKFLAENQAIPVGWHVAETPEESEFFQCGKGPFREFCVRHQLSPAFADVPGCSPTEFLRREGLLESAHYLFHFNHFTKEDLHALAPGQTVVHCPTTHHYFARAPFDLYSLQRAGVPVVLGTDSLATSDTLSMLETLRLAASSFPSLTSSQLLDMVTRIPGRSLSFLGVPMRLGVIARDSAADFVALASDVPLTSDVRKILCDSSTKVVATYIGGTKVYSLSCLRT